jgi:hypothetical protein
VVECPLLKDKYFLLFAGFYSNPSVFFRELQVQDDEVMQKLDAVLNKNQTDLIIVTQWLSITFDVWISIIIRYCRRWTEYSILKRMIQWIDLSYSEKKTEK